MRETARVQHWMCHCRSGALPSWSEQCLKQQKFNNARAIIVLVGHKTAGRLADRWANDSRDSRREFFMANFAAVVRWAVREKAKVQERMCHYLPVVRSVVRETVKIEHWTPVTWSGASLTQWTNISQNVIDEAVNYFRQILLPWWGERYVKKPEFNNARAIIVLAQQKRWATCGPLRQRLSSCVSNVNICHIFAAVGRQASRSVVRWAIREAAKVQHWMCHCRSVRFRRQVSSASNSQSSTMHVSLLSRQSKTAGARRVTDRWANDSRDSQREFFWQIVLPWWGERYVQKPQFNNARAIIVLAEQNSWATCGSLRLPTGIFWQILLPWW